MCAFPNCEVIMNTTNQSFKYWIVAMAAAVATVGALAVTLHTRANDLHTRFYSDTAPSQYVAFTASYDSMPTKVRL